MGSMPTEDEERPSPNFGTQAIVGAVATGVGIHLGGVAGGAAGAYVTPYLIALLKKVRDGWWQDQENNIADMAEAAMCAGGFSPENLAELAGRTSNTRLITATAVDSATRTAWPPKVRALG